MQRFVLVSGDQALFLPTFGPARVVVRPGQIVGKGPATRTGIAVCVDGDEASVVVRGCSYNTSEFKQPGSGDLSIQSLAPDQRASKTRTGGKPLLLVGSAFVARFTVQDPARKGLLVDPLRAYTGAGLFLSANCTFLAT